LSDGSRDSLLESVNISAIDSLAESSRDHIGAEGEELVSDLSSSEVLGVERGNEDGVVAVRVELGVDGSLVERCHLELVDGVLDDSSARLCVAGSVEDAVLWDHLDLKGTLSDDLEFGGTRMNVRSVEAASFEEANCHARSSANKCWECLAVCGNEITALSTLAFLGWITECELELIVLGEETEAVSSSIGDEKLGSETWSGWCSWWRSDGGCWRRRSDRCGRWLCSWSSDGDVGQDGRSNDGCELHVEKIGRFNLDEV